MSAVRSCGYRDDQGGVYSYNDALRWIHSDEGALDLGWCHAHGVLRLAAWESGGSSGKARAAATRCSTRPGLLRLRSARAP
jgi:hypothetical protein